MPLAVFAFTISVCASRCVPLAVCISLCASRCVHLTVCLSLYLVNCLPLLFRCVPLAVCLSLSISHRMLLGLDVFTSCCVPPTVCRSPLASCLPLVVCFSLCAPLVVPLAVCISLMIILALQAVSTSTRNLTQPSGDNLPHVSVRCVDL